ncbi:hypothetical protein C8F01DRAFT_1247260 [Mycena amicta]|nr:hypothetical protein C8F01DRAFT_1247260 [Mycena amicta]
MEPKTIQAEPTPSVILARLKQAFFPGLKCLQFWYTIGTSDELECEKTLLASLPGMFPLMEHLEFCRRWDHEASSLEGRWDPVPVAQKLVSEFKHLRTFRFDPDMPEQFGELPVIRPTRGFREMMGRLHAMAEAIVNEAPWLKRIDMYREYGRSGSSSSTSK